MMPDFDDGNTVQEKQQHTKDAFATLDGNFYQCTECDTEYPTHSHPGFDHCKELKHSIMKFHRETERELKDRQRAEKQKEEYQTMTLYVITKYHLVTLTKTHEILWYDGGVYRYGAEEIISQYIRLVEPKYTKHDIAEVMACIQDKTGYHTIDEFDADPMMINVKNGIVCIATGELLEHSPKYLSRVQLPVSFNPHVVARRFLRFIKTAQSDPHDVYRIFEMMGACLIRDNRFLTKAWMHLGKGSNGKSRLFDMLGAVLGEPNITSHSVHDIEKNRFALASLDGKLANICGDIEETELTKTGNLKKVIAGDMMPAEKKFMADYNFRPFCKLIFSANGLPQTPDESDGFARRFEIIEWSRQFYGKDRDFTVFTIMYDETELSGIFNIMVRHAVILQQTKHLKYESSVKDMKARWKERSNAAERFVNAECHRSADGQIEKARLYSSFVSFCKKHSLTILSHQKFNENIKKIGCIEKVTRINGISTKMWTGICLREDMRKDSQNSIL